MPGGVVIVGGGLGGAKTAEALRAQGFGGPITLLADEDELPYERPPLSKSYLTGDSAFASALVHPAEWYADNDVVLRRSTAATAIDRSASAVVTAAGAAV